MSRRNAIHQQLVRILALLVAAIGCSQHANPTLFLTDARASGDMAISPDGKTLAVANDDGNVKLWNLAAAKFDEIRGPFPYHERLNWDNRLAYSKRGQFLAVAFTQRAIVIRDIARGKEATRIPLDDAGVDRLTFTTDDTEIVALLLDSHPKADEARPRTNSAVRWDVTTGTRRRTTRLGRDVSFGALSADGRYAVAELPRQPSGARDEGIYVLELATGARLFQVGGANPDPFWGSLAGSWVFLPDGSTLVTCNQRGIIIRELIKAAITGFSYNSPVDEWARRHFEFVKSRVDRDYPPGEFAQYGQNGENIKVFFALSLGFLLGAYQAGHVSDEEFKITEQQIPGIIMLHLPSLTSRTL